MRRLYLAHIEGFFRELSVGYKCDIILLEQVLEMTYVVGIFLSLFCQRSNAAPFQMLKQFQVSLPAKHKCVTVLGGYYLIFHKK